MFGVPLPGGGMTAPLGGHMSFPFPGGMPPMGGPMMPGAPPMPSMMPPHGGCGGGLGGGLGGMPMPQMGGPQLGMSPPAGGCGGRRKGGGGFGGGGGCGGGGGKGGKGGGGGGKGGDRGFGGGKGGGGRGGGGGGRGGGGGGRGGGGGGGCGGPGASLGGPLGGAGLVPAVVPGAVMPGGEGGEQRKGGGGKGRSRGGKGGGGGGGGDRGERGERGERGGRDGNFSGGWVRIPTVAPDFVIDESKTFSGTVSFFSKLKGYGFIEVKEKGIVPEDRVFVQWRSIKSKDRFPFLVKDMEVEFQVTKWTGYGPKAEVSLRAMEVSLLGGEPIHLQDEIDAEKKVFIGDQNTRYKGTLKFYNPRYGFGYITVNPEFVTGEGEDAVPSELRVERSEVNAGGQNPGSMEEVEVEFGIWKTNKNILKAYNVTFPGGNPLTLETIENRKGVGAQMYRGEVNVWNSASGWGFIKLEDSTPLPPDVQEKLTKQTQDAKKRAEERGREGSDEELLYVRRDDVQPNARLRKGLQVMFQVYVDDKGVGCCQVQPI